MRASRSSRLAWIPSLAIGAALGMAAWHPPEPCAAAGSTGRSEGALEELARARLEQSLIRAEATARLLELLPPRAVAAGAP